MRKPDRFLKEVRGVIHVGGNTGQEIPLYAKYGLPVIWVEPIPEIFRKLKLNLIGIPKQHAIQALVTDFDGKNYEFHIANNNGASSSIYEFKLHQDIWPEIKFEKTIELKSQTLSTLLKDNHINLAEYDTLIMDTQGSELLVLQGAIPILKHFNYIKTEVTDFESYKGCCQLKDIETFLQNYGYSEFFRHRQINHPEGGSYFDIIYKKISEI